MDTCLSGTDYVWRIAPKEEDTMSDCLPKCDVNAFDETTGHLLGAHRRAIHNIAIELETIGDNIEDHRVAIMLLERRRAYLLGQANEEVPIAPDQNK